MTTEVAARSRQDSESLSKRTRVREGRERAFDRLQEAKRTVDTSVWQWRSSADAVLATVVVERSPYDRASWYNSEECFEVSNDECQIS